MLELQKNFLLVKFFNQIFCIKGLKAKISCFFSFFFFLFNLCGAGKFKLQKDHFVLEVTKAEEIQKSASTELHECWKLQLFEGKLQSFISYLSEMNSLF